MPNPIQIIDLNRIGYKAASAVLETIYQRCDQDLYPDTIIFQENDPIITLGRGSDLSNLLKSEEELREMGIEVAEVDRGGDITYHGPGQLVISVMIHIRRYSLTVHQYLRNLEEVVIRILAGYGIDAERIEGKSGVWVNEKKIAATGIAVTHGITRHGIAINIEPDLAHYDTIIPCGISDKGVTSLKELNVSTWDMEDIKRKFIRMFNEIFDTVTVEPCFKEGDINHEN